MKNATHLLHSSYSIFGNILDIHLGLNWMGREDAEDKVICLHGEELQHHSCSEEFGKGTTKPRIMPLLFAGIKAYAIQE